MPQYSRRKRGHKRRNTYSNQYGETMTHTRGTHTGGNKKRKTRRHRRHTWY